MDDGDIQAEPSQATFFNDTFSQAEVAQALSKVNKEEKKEPEKEKPAETTNTQQTPANQKLTEIQKLMKNLSTFMEGKKELQEHNSTYTFNSKQTQPKDY